MKKQLILAAIISLAAFGPEGAHGQGFTLIGGRGLPHLNTAWTLAPGQYTLHVFGSSFYKAVVIGGKPPTSDTYWDVQSAMALHYASSKHLEWSAAPVLYQDSHRDKGYNVPDDIFVRLKLGAYGHKVSPLKFGAVVSTRLPVAKDHNVIFEPYSGGGVELGLTGIMSFSPDLLIPENAFNFHLNFGFWHHNDVGKLLTGVSADTTAVLDPTREFLWGAGVAFPSNQFDFTFELYGRLFLVRPPETAYSREDAIYFSPSITYRPRYWAALNVGFDFRLSGNDELTKYINGLKLVHQDLPSYPDWRVNFGARFNLNQTPPPDNKPLFISSNGRLVPRQKSLEKQLTLEKQKTESAEDELEKIRSDRKRMESMLARLRTLLYEGKVEDQDKQNNGGQNNSGETTEKKPGVSEKKEQ